MGGRQPASHKAGHNKLYEPDSSTVSKKCCHLFGRDPKIRRQFTSLLLQVRTFFLFCSFYRTLYRTSPRTSPRTSAPRLPAAARSSLLQFCLLLMAIVSPFRAWRYDPERVPLQQVVTQPYDKITPAMQERYYQASPYNLVRIILGKRLPEDGESENVYTRAAASFQGWRQTGILQRDAEPSIYRYSQTFTVPGGQARAERRAFIALGRI